MEDLVGIPYPNLNEKIMEDLGGISYPIPKEKIMEDLVGISYPRYVSDLWRIQRDHIL